jgi:hypothetical protein
MATSYDGDLLRRRRRRGGRERKGRIYGGGGGGGGRGGRCSGGRPAGGGHSARPPAGGRPNADFWDFFEKNKISSPSAFTPLGESFRECAISDSRGMRLPRGALPGLPSPRVASGKASPSPTGPSPSASCTWGRPCLP